MAYPASNPVGDILEPQGKHHGWWSLKPLTEAAEFAKTPGPYFKKSQEANGGAPVYKIHPGLASIALTDHASAKWFFEQPETVLDRQVSCAYWDVQGRGAHEGVCTMYCMGTLGCHESLRSAHPCVTIISGIVLYSGTKKD